MGKTPAQQNRLKAKQQGMSHDSIKEQQAKEIREQKKLANKDINFGREKGLLKKQEVAKQRLKDMNDPTTELGKATARAARKAAKEAEEFLLRTKGISIKQKEVPEGVDPKTILCEYFRYCREVQVLPRPRHRPEDPRGKLGHRQEEHLRRR